MNRERTIVISINKITGINIGALDIKTESIAGVVRPDIGVSGKTGGGEIASRIGDGSRAIAQTQGVILDCFDGVAIGTTCGHGQNVREETGCTWYEGAIVEVEIANFEGKGNQGVDVLETG